MSNQPDRAQQRLCSITLDEQTMVRRSADIEHECKVAVFDLLEENYFAPVGSDAGPYELHLRIEENRLIFEICREGGVALGRVGLGLSSFRRIVKDYFQICESYFQAIKTASPSRIEAIDMGRRGIHNDGSELLKERLRGKIDVDHDTARRLFTLICILHIRA